MSFDWNSAAVSLAGGALIGLAAAMFILLNGRIAGVSGIVAGLLTPARGDVGWRVAFVLGLLVSPGVYGLVASLPRPQVDAGWGLVALAGLVVGVGTRYGSGCTSGHGVCGVSRLSPRSMVATVAFIAAGFVTVWLLRHGLGAGRG